MTGALEPPITVEWDLKKNTDVGPVVGAVPETSTWALLATGMLLVALRGPRLTQARAL